MNRMNIAALLCLLAAGTAGCDDKNNTNNRTGSTGTRPEGSPPATNPSSTTPRTTTPTTPHEPDNTANNKRDRNTTTTPMDQSNDKMDIDITAKIRSAIVGDKSMSTNAQNCKIITNKGVVTLRGVVNSDAEKAAVEAIAKGTAGVTSVDNQLEVAPPK